jgi:hypothetical protein
MKGKLIKRKDRWDLYYDKDISMINTIASSEDNPKGKLCLKNCESIERGYNLDELIEESYEKHRVNDKDYSINEQIQRSGGFSIGYEEGFKKALELLVDKKFGINEVVELCKILMSNPFEKCGKSYQELTDNYVQSLQPKELDVEIEMEEVIIGQCDCECHSNTGIMVMHFMPCCNPKVVSNPKLDSNDCLILKRIL